MFQCSFFSAQRKSVDSSPSKSKKEDKLSKKDLEKEKKVLSVVKCCKVMNIFEPNRENKLFNELFYFHLLLPNNFVINGALYLND